MSAHFEVVRSDGTQEWAAHFVSNGHVLFASAHYSRMVDAERAILSFANAATPSSVRWSLKWNVEGIEKVFVRSDGSPASHAPLVKYVDRRRNASGAASPLLLAAAWVALWVGGCAWAVWAR